MAAKEVQDREYLRGHPLAARSFATSVPVTSMFILSILEVAELPTHRTISVDRALTMIDVLGMIRKKYVPPNLPLDNVTYTSL